MGGQRTQRRRLVRPQDRNSKGPVPDRKTAAGDPCPSSVGTLPLYEAVSAGTFRDAESQELAKDGVKKELGSSPSFLCHGWLSVGFSRLRIVFSGFVL
jgi:hypothetical protein